MPSPGTLRRNRDFRLFLVVVGLSRLGTQVSFLALPLLTLRLTGSPARTGSLALLEGVVFLTMSLPGGALADHFPRRATMVACALGCGAAMGGLAAAVSLHHASFALIAAAVVVIGVLGGVFAPASGASIRTIVAEGDLLDAYSALEARSAVLFLVGPPLGGFLFSVSAQVPLWTDGASYVVCALGVLAVRTPLGRPRVPVPVPADADGDADASPASAAGGRTDTVRSLARGAAAGMVFVWRNAFLRYCALGTAVLNAAFQSAIFLLILAFARDGRGATATGLVISAWGMGALAGSVLARRVTKRYDARQTLLGVTWACAVLVPLLAVAHGAVVAVIAVVAGCGLLAPSHNAVAAGTLARLTPEHLQGRVQSAAGLMSMAGAPFGPLLAGIAFQSFALWTLFVALGVLIAVVALAGQASAALRTVPAAPGQEPRLQAVSGPS